MRADFNGAHYSRGERQREPNTSLTAPVGDATSCIFSFRRVYISNDGCWGRHLGSSAFNRPQLREGHARYSGSNLSLAETQSLRDRAR